jgi:hypothetical protein
MPIHPSGLVWVKHRDAAGRTAASIRRAIKALKCERAERIWNHNQAAFLKVLAKSKTLDRLRRDIEECYHRRNIRVSFDTHSTKRSSDWRYAKTPKYRRS